MNYIDIANVTKVNKEMLNKLLDGKNYIPDYFFRDCSELVEIELSDNIEFIGKQAFENCVRLKKVTNLQNVKKIETMAFFGCWSITELVFSEKLKYIGSQAFSECRQLKKIFGLNNIEIINAQAFFNCQHLYEIDSLRNVKSIEGDAFANCISLQKLDLSIKLEAIKSSAFKNCASLRELGDLGNVKRLGASAFEKCVNLEKLDTFEELEYIGICAFDNCTKLAKVGNLSKVKEIGSGAFFECYSIETLNFSSNLNSIGKIAFNKCSNLKYLGRLDNVRILGDLSFCGCINLRELSFSDKLIDIGEKCFYKCEKLERVDNLTGISAVKLGTFAYCTSLKKLDLSDKVESIEEDAFFHDCSLVIVGNLRNVKKVGINAFFGCSKLEKLNFSDKLKEINTQAFEYCKSLYDLGDLSGVKKLYDRVFCNCEKMEEFIFSEKINILGEFIFENCNSLKKIKFIKKKDIDKKSLNFIEVDGIKIQTRDDIEIINCYFSGCYSIDVILSSGFFIQDDSKLLSDYIWKLKRIKCLVDFNILKTQEYTSIIINYIDYLELIKLFDSYKKSGLQPVNFDTSISVTFKGIKLTILEKINIKKLFSKCYTKKIKKWNFEFSSMDNNKLFYEFDSEINSLLNRVDNLISNISGSPKESILNLRNKLILEYEKNKNHEKPELDFTSKVAIPTFNKSFIGNAKLNLMIGLNNILLLFSRQEKLLDSLSKIDKYNIILNSNSNKLIENANTVEDVLHNLVFLSNSFNDDIKRDLICKINNCLISTKNKYEEELKTVYDNFDNKAIKLVNAKTEPMTELFSNLLSIYDSYSLYYNKIKPFLLLKDALVNPKKEIANCQVDGDILNIISYLDVLIANILNEEKKNELKRKYDTIKKRYIEIIDETVKYENSNNLTYDNLVLQLRKDIHPILIFLNDCFNYCTSIDKSLKMLSNTINNFNSIERYDKNSIIDSFIRDINNIMLENSFTSDEQTKVNDAVKDILNKYLTIIKEQKSSLCIEDFNNNLYSELAGIYLKIQIYSSKSREYKKIYVKSDNYVGGNNL